MSKVLVHNISDRQNSESRPQAYVIGGVRVGPGKFIEVDSRVLNDKLKRLHGKSLWFGPLHQRFVRTSRSALRTTDSEVKSGVAPMSLQEAKDYLAGLTLSDLKDLCKNMAPPLDFPRESISKGAIEARLSRTLFNSGREFDPEAFFWLRRWERIGKEYRTR